MIQYQYELFEPIPDEVTILRQEIADMRLSQNKQCRAQFAKIGASGKEIIEMKDEIHRLKFEVEALRKMISVS